MERHGDGEPGHSIVAPPIIMGIALLLPISVGKCDTCTYKWALHSCLGWAGLGWAGWAGWAGLGWAGLEV